MARTSEPNALRTFLSYYWVFEDFGMLKTEKFLQNYWLLYGFTKIFETTRDRITVLTDYHTSRFFLFFSILLLITKQGFIKNKQEALKRRILFKLFRGYLRIRRKIKNKKIQLKWKKNLFNLHYKHILEFVSTLNSRFTKYCMIACQKSKNLLSSLIEKKNSALIQISNLLARPLRLHIADVFSAIDRNYILLWQNFYNFVKGQLWFAKNMRYFLSTIKVCFITTFKPNVKLLADHIAFLLKKSRQHWQIIKTLIEIVQIMHWFTPAFHNIKISINGCIADSERTRSIIIGQNSVITQTLTSRVDYAIAHAATPFGALGVKIWMLIKNG